MHPYNLRNIQNIQKSKIDIAIEDVINVAIVVGVAVVVAVVVVTVAAVAETVSGSALALN